MREITPFQIKVNNENVLNTFSGGMNNPEVQFVDLDGDNDFDALVLSSDNTFEYYRNEGDEFSSDFKIDVNEFQDLEISDWFYFVDIDADEDFDLFTGSRIISNFISFYRNIGNKFQHNFLIETDTLLENSNQPVFAENVSNPIFSDVDGDNDFDFIAGSQLGTLVYYENVGSAENYEYQFVTNQWQNIVINDGLNKSNHHGASSHEFVDIDSDSDLDLFWGDLFHTSLYFLENQGTPQNPNHVRVLDLFPMENNPINTRGFNMSRFTDIDSDNDLDMFISELWSFDTPNLLMYYENIGDEINYNYQLSDKNFIETLDLGVFSYPAFIDIDNDNDFDLIVGIQKNGRGILNCFENTGNFSNPTFELKDTLFGGINFDLAISPTFGDLDNDGDKDLVLGSLNRFLLVYENRSNGINFDFTLTDTLSFFSGETNLLSTNTTPILIDIDSDDDLDIAVGGFNGKLKLLLNNGSPLNYNFEVVQNYFSDIDVGNASAPTLFDFNNDNILDLFVGNLEGKIFYFENTGSNINPNLNLITDSFIDENFGNYSVPVFVDIDNDSDSDLFIGNVKGGLYFYRNDDITGIYENTSANKLLVDFSLDAYPNPFNASVKIRIQLNDNVKANLNIYNLLGQKIKTIFEGGLLSGEFLIDWNGTNDDNILVATGNYIIVLEVNKYIKSIPISLIK